MYTELVITFRGLVGHRIDFGVKSGSSQVGMMIDAKILMAVYELIIIRC